MQELYVDSSSTKGESFKDVYLKLRFPFNDTLLSRLEFPLTITSMINSQDWKTDKYPTLMDFRKSLLFQKTIKSIKESLPYNENYQRIFAALNLQGQQLRIIYKGKGLRFASKNGRWFLVQYSESLFDF